MENVSHNTSFDSNDDNLSRATNQQPFDEDQDAQAEQNQNQQEQQQSFERGFTRHNRQESAQETERNPYGFDPNSAAGENPSQNVQQALWEDFQRAQQASSTDQQRPFDPPNYQATFAQEEQFSDQVSRPTAAFGNQGASPSLLQYPDEIQIEEEVEDNLDGLSKGKNMHFNIDDKNATQTFQYEDREDASVNLANGQQNILSSQAQSETRKLQSASDLANHPNQFNYRQEFARRYYPDQQLSNQIVHSKELGPEPSSDVDQSLQQHDESNHDKSSSQLQQYQSKKRTRADFLSKTSFQSEMQKDQAPVVMHSHQSSASKESILQSVRKQQNKHVLKAVADQKGQSQSYNSIVEHSQINDSSVKPSFEVAINANNFDQRQRRDSFPNSDEAAGEHEDSKSRSCLLLCMLQTKICSRKREQRLQTRLAFDKLFLNRQSSFMEQLLTDNENLMDQIQELQVNKQQNTYTSQGTQAPSQSMLPEKSIYELYNNGAMAQTSGMVIGRNNEKTDQTTHSSLDNNNALSNKIHPQHTGNSSNKEVSPAQGLNQRENAFMRAMIRDESPMMKNHNNIQLQQQSPYHRGSNLNDDRFQPNHLIQDGFFESFQNKLNDLASQMQTLKASISVEMRVKIEELCRSFDQHSDKIRSQCSQIDQTKDLLSTKVQGVDRLELENLELHMQLDAKLRALETLLRCGTDASKLFKFDHKKSCEAQAQTDTVYSDLVSKEATLQIFSKELSLVKLRQEEDFSAKVREMEKRESDLEIRERLIEEKRIEYSYKQKELNQRIKGQMTWPLNCLENDTKLLEKFKDFKLKPDHLKTLEADSNLSLFLQREENQQLMHGLQGDMYVKCEGLLHFEYLLLKERAKNIVFHDNAISELTTLQAESEELTKDRERYQISSDLERQLQQESQRVDKSRMELIQIQENFFKIVSTLSEAFQNLNFVPQQQSQQASSLNVSPHGKGSQGQLPQNQLSLLLGSLHRSQPSDQVSSSARISAAINPYSQTISAKDPATLLQVVNDYRATDPMLNKLQSKDMQTLIETTIDHLQSSSRVASKNAADPDQQSKEVANLRQIRRMLVRDAYFLQKERQWLDQERLKLNAALSRATRRKSNERRTAQVQTSLERHQTNTRYHNGESLPVQPQHQRLNTENSFSLQNHSRQQQRDFSPAIKQHINQMRHTQKESMDSSIRHGGNNNISVTSGGVDNLSMMSALEQDRKKIQLLQTNLALEKDYNTDLNTQLTAQMELIKMQNEKLIEGESHINEMKLRLLIKFEQIKVLEDFYNRHHTGEFEQQIHLDIELDDDQLRQIVIQLYQKHQKDSNADLNWHLGQHPQPLSDQEDDQHSDLGFNYNNNFNGHDRSQNSTQLLSALVPSRKAYHENWALSGVSALLRHLLMEKCKFNPANQRLQYAFMLFKCATLESKQGFNQSRKNLNGTQQLKELLQESTPLESQLDESQPGETVQDITDQSILIDEAVNNAEQQILAEPIKATQHKSVGTDQMTENTSKVMVHESMDWFELYWQKKRSNYFTDQIDIDSSKLRDIAAQLESDIASFWKFRARNTLRLMQVHMGRRKRLVHAFAFQKFKVQTMKATIQRLINSKVQTHTGVSILNASPRDELSADRRLQQTSAAEMTIAKRHAIVIMLTQRNEKLQNMKQKYRLFRKWKDSVEEASSFTMQLEVARLAKEIETVKFREEMLRTNFTVQKSELQSKLTVLLGLIAS